MPNATCKEDGCGSEIATRELCKLHYGRAYRSGSLGELDNGWHRVTEVDEAANTGTCSQCGPVGVYIRTDGKVRCRVRRRQHEKNVGPRTRKSQGLKIRLKKYGLTQDAFDALVLASEGRCAICDVAFDGKFHIDHCHATGAVRGLLCLQCNWAIGLLGDNPARVLSAYMYLKAHGKSD